jgi:multiple sugar transport system permease protein
MKGLKKETLVFVLPALLLILFFLLLPVLESLAMSLLSNDGTGRFVGMENYTKLFRDPAFVNVQGILHGQPPFGALVNNLVWIAVHLPLSMLLGLGCALLLIGLPRLSGLRPMIFIGMIVPGVITGIVTNFLFEKSSGMVSNFFGLIGIKALSVSWFSHPETALPALILTCVWTWTGYSMVVFFAALTAIPPSHVEAARIEGANGWQLLRYVKLPCLRPSVRTVVVMSVISELTSFDIVYSSTYGGPGGASNVMGFQMYLESFRYSHFGTGAAIATIITLIAAIPIVINVRSTVARS